MFFSPVCFLPCRAAWPEVVNVSVQANVLAWGQGYFFLVMGVLLLTFALELFEVVMGVLGSALMVAEGGAWDMGGREVVVAAEEGVGC